MGCNLTQAGAIRPCCAAIFAGAVALLGQPAMSKPPASFEQIAAVVDRHLKNNHSYAPGDLITQGDVEPIFNELLELGVRPTDTEELYDSFLPENNFLVRMIRSSKGRKFMRQVANIPDVYDRLERLSWIPEGRELLVELINSPQGPASLESLLSTAGINALKEKLSHDPRGKNFDFPTGHIHTAKQLLEHLRETYANNTVRRGGKGK